MRYWILDEHKVPTPVHDLLTWGRWFEDGEKRRVAFDEIDGVRISTVFLGIDHNFGDGPPLLFETMVFGGEHDGHQDRAATWDEAQTQHALAISLVKGYLEVVDK